VSVGTVGEPITLPSGALLIVNADGTFNYDPNHKFDYLPTPDSGASNLTYVDTFSYAITGGDTATVTVTVSGVDTNDVLYDSAVDDTLAGGIGDDLYYVHNTGDVVIEATNGGHDTVGAYVDYTLPDNSNIELLSMLGSGLTGTGSSGADTLHSAGGPNTLKGLGGDDHYYVNNSADEVIEEANGGNDTVGATVDYTLPENHHIETLSMLGPGLTGTGSAGADTLHSNGGPNTLEGLGGDDLYYVNNSADRVTEEANGGNDTVVATVNYTLQDNPNVETLYVSGSGLTGTGNSDANTLVTVGANTLVGDDGNDSFVFYAGSSNGATVTDFDGQAGELDQLVFSGFGTEADGATFLRQIGTTDQWQVHSGLDDHNETITLSNLAAPGAGDFVFF
jgi:Ca2+-binding RTX toxin-like protein